MPTSSQESMRIEEALARMEVAVTRIAKAVTRIEEALRKGIDVGQMGDSRVTRTPPRAGGA